MTSTVLATSTDGSTSSEFAISVTDDVSDNNTNIGPKSDSDTTPNQVDGELSSRDISWDYCIGYRC